MNGKPVNLLKSQSVVSSRVGCLLSFKRHWKAISTFSDRNATLRLVTKSDEKTYDLLNVVGIEEKTWLLWSIVTLSFQNSSITLPGIWLWDSQKFSSGLRHYIVKTIEVRVKTYEIEVAKIYEAISQFLNQDCYLRHTQLKEFIVTHMSTTNDVKACIGLLNHPFAKLAVVPPCMVKQIDLIRSLAAPHSPLVQQRNARFVESEMVRCEAFFDRVEKTPLTKEQRVAAIVFEDRNLLVAAAGSGKSSTLVGKIGYAVQRTIFPPEQIIALAFNRDAAVELNQRIGVRVRPWLNGTNIKAHTFHGLGLHIVKKVLRSQRKRIRISRPNEEMPRLRSVLSECMQREEFSSDWLNFLALCREPAPREDAFGSEDEYKAYVERQREARRNGQPAPYKSLSGYTVNSSEELAIANWLYVNGVPFLYEKPFSPIPETWVKYEPDFYYPDIDVWHEHFAINSQGRAPSSFGNYVEQARFKRNWLNLHASGKWFETQSHEYRSGTLIDKLREFLHSRGQVFHSRSQTNILETIKTLGEDDSLGLILRIFHLVKGNYISKNAFSVCINSLEDKFRGKFFEKVFWPLYDAYEAKLKGQGKIDFNDMIIHAAHYLEQQEFLSPYRFIAVDEFQDLSLSRARLIKALLKQHSTGILFGVGDDWQAINGFAGSNLQYFMNFKEEFGNSFESKLSETFRCAQGISDVSAEFIQKNDRQKHKTVRSNINPSTNQVIDLIPIKDDDYLKNEIDLIIKNLYSTVELRSVEGKTSKLSILILSRYGIANTKGITDEWMDELKIRYPEFGIEFMTMHKSKGLEADYVFLVGLNSGQWMAFPSTFTNDPLVDMLLPNSERFPFAEERRLFYVALTRAKRKAFLLFRQNEPSAFVMELTASVFEKSITYKGGVLPSKCSKCDRGFMVLKDGPHGKFWGCTRFSRAETGCNNTGKYVKPTDNT